MGPIFLACTEGVSCGPGTQEVDGRCLPLADTSVPPVETADTDPVDPVDDTSTSEPALVYLLAGQSNMVGLGQVTALPPSQRQTQDDVQIYWSGREGWQALQPSSAGSNTWVTYIGPEVSFGRAMKDAQPEREVYLIKHADGGTALADWWQPGEHADDVENQGLGYQIFHRTVVEEIGRAHV